MSEEINKRILDDENFPPVPGGASDYQEAVRASRFVKGFGIANLCFTIFLLSSVVLPFIQSNLNLGLMVFLSPLMLIFEASKIISLVFYLLIGILIIKYEATNFYKYFGILVLIGCLSGLLGALILSTGILWKSRNTLRLIESESCPKRYRANSIIGYSTSVVALILLVISTGFFIYLLYLFTQLWTPAPIS